ncbi:MAG: type II toxin-antitoxin system RelE/ParE family toxin [Deltaproteobacteria bacterium]|nr:type II toxin-antitoxin system RelE/ParE family toxin [Deltaproteobacteria bacterium]
MDREIVWSRWASDDLVPVAEHISRDSESYAATIVRELVAAARSLRVFAERGRRVPEYDDPAIRELIVRKYRLVYRVHPNRVEVVRIIHGAREMPSSV